MQKIHNEHAPEIVGRKIPFFKRSSKEGIDLTNIDSNCPDEKYCENLVGKKKLGASKIMVRKNFHCNCGAMHSNIIMN